MVTTITKTEERTTTEIRQVSLIEDLGKILGIPIKVLPWWGSVRRRHLNGDRRWYWDCPGGMAYTRIKRPEIKKGVILLWEGPCRYKPSYYDRHNHSQTIELKSIAEKSKALLITIRASGYFSQYLIGMDEGSPYVVPVRRSLKTAEEALDWLMPNIVKEAVAQGLTVLRQGDWYFIPTNRKPKRCPDSSQIAGSAPSLRVNTLYNGAFLVYNSTQTRHRGTQVCYQSIQGLPGPAPLVKGKVTAPNHKPLYLNDWHIGVRNRSTPWRNVDRERAKFDD